MLLRFSKILFFVTAICLELPLSAQTDDIVSYSSLDEAIEAEIEGIDFSDMSDVDEFAIRGRSLIAPDVMTAFVRRYNADFDHEIAEEYINVGRKYGIRGDIAFCQAILETGWFRFDRGTAVEPTQHNYCGLGVVRNGLRGACFISIHEGVTAHIQHLYAYAGRDPLPDGEILVDPRFSAVKRGVATEWSDLNNRWAMNPLYGSKILKIYSDLRGFYDESGL